MSNILKKRTNPPKKLLKALPMPERKPPWGRAEAQPRRGKSRRAPLILQSANPQKMKYNILSKNTASPLAGESR